MRGRRAGGAVQWLAFTRQESTAEDEDHWRNADEDPILLSLSQPIIAMVLPPAQPASAGPMPCAAANEHAKSETSSFFQDQSRQAQPDKNMATEGVTVLPPVLHQQQHQQQQPMYQSAAPLAAGGLLPSSLPAITPPQSPPAQNSLPGLSRMHGLHTVLVPHSQQQTGSAHPAATHPAGFSNPPQVGQKFHSHQQQAASAADLAGSSNSASNPSAMPPSWGAASGSRSSALGLSMNSAPAGSSSFPPSMHGQSHAPLHPAPSGSAHVYAHFSDRSDSGAQAMGGAVGGSTDGLAALSAAALGMSRLGTSQGGGETGAWNGNSPETTQSVFRTPFPQDVPDRKLQKPQHHDPASASQSPSLPNAPLMAGRQPFLSHVHPGAAASQEHVPPFSPHMAGYRIASAAQAGGLPFYPSSAPAGGASSMMTPGQGNPPQTSDSKKSSRGRKAAGASAPAPQQTPAQNAGQGVPMDMDSYHRAMISQQMSMGGEASSPSHFYIQ
jgi:hypothetical protein